LSCVVPVLPAIGRPKLAAAPVPPFSVTFCRAYTTLAHWSGESAWCRSAAGALRTVPSDISTRRIEVGSMWVPLFWNVEYADAMSSTDTEPVPSTIDGYGCNVAVIPRSFAVFTTFSGPRSIMSCA
jgi:hypothetical protein